MILLAIGGLIGLIVSYYKTLHLFEDSTAIHNVITGFIVSLYIMAGVGAGFAVSFILGKTLPTKWKTSVQPVEYVTESGLVVQRGKKDNSPYYQFISNGHIEIIPVVQASFFYTAGDQVVKEKSPEPSPLAHMFTFGSKPAEYQFYLHKPQLTDILTL